MGKIILSLLLSICFYSAESAAETITGKAEARDGDSLVIEGQRIRLKDVDAPERDQPCELENGEEFYPGREAKAWLQSIINNQIVSCEVETTDRYKRKVATCYVNDINIGEKLAHEGFSFANSLYSERYEAFEREAKDDKLGLWRGTCEQPWVWRKKNPR